MFEQFLAFAGQKEDIMRILIINPNSDPGITRKIEEAAQAFAAGEFEVVCRATPGAPRFIETYEDQAQAAVQSGVGRGCAP